MSSPISTQIPRIQTCTLCELYKGRTKICSPIGPMPSDMLFVGEAPGPDEDKWGAPFVGSAGKVLDMVFQQTEIDRLSVAITNTIMCWPGRGDDGQIAKPPAESIEACRDHLENTIQQVNPRVIVALGATAFKALTGAKTAIGKARGTAHKVVIRGTERTVVPTYHPSYALRSGAAGNPASDKVQQIVADVRFAQSLLAPVKSGEYHVVKTTEDFDEFLAEARTWERFAFDIETDGLPVLGTKIIGIAFSGRRGTGWYIPLLWWGPDDSDLTNYWPVYEGPPEEAPDFSQQWVVLILKSILEGPEMKAAHGGKFDVARLRTSLGINVNNWSYDTMLGAWCLNEHDKTTRLGDLLAQRYADLVGYKAEMRAAMGTEEGAEAGLPFIQQPLDSIGLMGAKDADGTLRLAEDQWPELVEQGLVDFYRRFMLPTAKLMAKIEERGMAVDLDYLQELRTRCQTQLDKCSAAIVEGSGNPDLNPRSHKQLVEYFFTKMGYPVVSKTKKGAPSVDASVLEVLAAKHGDPVARAIIDHREVDKIMGTYLDPLPGMLLSDGRVHASFHITRTVSGRASCSDPNMQNIPTRTELGNEVRNVFVARPGWSLICADFSQMELRVIAYESQDERLLEACSTGEDLHTAIARIIFKIPDDQPVPKSVRSTSKNVQFSVAYGAAPDKVAAMTGISVFEAEEVIRQWFDTFKKVRPWIDGVRQDLSDKGYTTTCFGMRRRAPELMGLPVNSAFDAIMEETRRSCVNTRIQGPASQFCWHNLNLLDQWLTETGHPAILINQVHDAGYIECPDELCDVLVPEVRRILTQPVPPVTVPMAVDIHVVKRWGDA